MSRKSVPKNSKELALLLGLSQSTVSRALNDSPRIPQEVKERICSKAEELGFELNSQARGLRTQKTGTVGVLFPQHFRSMNENLMLANIFDHLQRKLIASGYDLQMVYDYGSGAGTSVLERMIRRRKLDGLILFRNRLSASEIKLVLGTRFPCVYMLNSSTVHKKISHSISDVEYGGYLAGKFFGQFHDFRPLFVGIKEDPMEKLENQCRGVQKGLAEHGRKIADADICQCSLSIAAAYDFIMRRRRKFLNSKVAIYPHADIIAIGMMAALKDLGVSIPEQAQIIGADDIPMAQWVRPRMSSVHVPVEAMVEEGCRQLQELIESGGKGVHTAKFKPTLVLRETTLPGNDE